MVNFQILPGDRIDGVLERIRAVIADPMVEVRPLPGGIEFESSPISDISSPAFAVIAKSIRQSIGPNPPFVVPFLTGPTDSRHGSTAGARIVFRFTPFAYEQDWMSRAHGTDERIQCKPSLMAFDSTCSSSVTWKGFERDDARSYRQPPLASAKGHYLTIKEATN